MGQKTRTREEVEAEAAKATTPEALKRLVRAAQGYKQEYGPQEWWKRRFARNPDCGGHTAYGRYTYTTQEHDDDHDCCFRAALARWYSDAAAWGEKHEH